MLSSEMRACGILHQDQPKRKLRTAIENIPSGQLLIANNTPLSSATRGQRLTFTPVEDYYTGRRDATSGIMFGNMSTNDIEIPSLMTISLLHFQNFVLHNILLVKDILNHTNH